MPRSDRIGWPFARVQGLETNSGGSGRRLPTVLPNQCAARYADTCLATIGRQRKPAIGRNAAATRTPAPTAERSAGESYDPMVQRLLNVRVRPASVAILISRDA